MDQSNPFGTSMKTSETYKGYQTINNKLPMPSEHTGKLTLKTDEAAWNCIDSAIATIHIHIPTNLSA